MKYNLKDYDISMIERICEKLGITTNIDDNGYIEVDDILAILSDLENEVLRLEEKQEDFLENHKPCDVNDNWQYYANTIQKLSEENSKQYQFIIKKGLKEEYDENR